MTTMNQSSPTHEDFHIEIKPLHIIPSTELFYPDLTYTVSGTVREIDLLLIARIIISSTNQSPQCTESCAIIPIERVSDITENLRYAADSSLMFFYPIREFTE